MRKPIFITVALGLLTVSGVAAAQYPPPPPPPAGGGYPGGGYGYAPPAPVGQRFGDQGQLVISNDANVAFSGTSYTNNQGSDWTLTLQPALDYFVIPNLSVGGVVQFSHSEFSSGSTANQPSQTSSANTYGIGARVGYNLGISDSFSFWPKLGLLYVGNSTNPAGGAQGISGSAFDVQIYAPFLLHPVKHFFFGIGPFLQTDLTASQSQGGVSNPNPTKQTTYGLLFDLGGWMDF
ncbi:MAG TPA: hypothetical protein VIF09_23660 [Polyangiaceae bacterium]